MELALFFPKVIRKKPLEQDFWWYDHINRQMLHGRGGKMSFEYDNERQMSVPVLEDVYEDLLEYDDTKIMEWIQENQESYGLKEINKHKDYVVIEFDDKYADEVKTVLFFQRIRNYDY